ncbi:MAG TPA: hypothetical protein PLP17_08685 [Oligoflexia bacterium]|nr:hypothetical protein [Oligoflexia bacterium]
MAVPRKRKRRSSTRRGRRLLDAMNLPQTWTRGTAKKPPDAQVPPSAQENKKRPRRSIRQVLYENNAEGLFRMVFFLPLFLGAWLAGGVVLNEIVSFAALTGAVILASYEVNFRKDDIIFAKELRLVIYAGITALLYCFFDLTGSPVHLLLAVFAAVLAATFNYLSLKTPFSVLCACTAVVLEMSLLALLGIYSQSYAHSSEVIWQRAAIGFVPGLTLASSLVAKYAPVFQKAGWVRKIEKAGQSKITARPGSLSTLFSLLLLSGPAVPVSLAPLPHAGFPTPFLICAAAFYFIPKLAQAFLESTASDAEIAVKCTNLAALLCALVFVAVCLTAVMG